MSLFGFSRARRPGYSIIDEGMSIHGELDTAGIVRVEGKLEGSVHRAGTLIVTANGTITGDVEAADVTVSGIVHGNIHATGRVEIVPGATVYGQVRAALMHAHEGATIHGQVAIGAAPAAVLPPAPRHLELAPSPTGRARL